MTWPSHLMGGLSALWLLEILPDEISHGATIENVALWAGVAALGSLLPDLDAAQSKIKHLSFSGIKPFYLPSQAIFHTFGHRTLLHSLYGVSAISAVALTTSPLISPQSINWQAPLALVLGYASHLALDACNPSGIPLLYPNRKRLHLLPKPWRVVTGSPLEELFFAGFAVLTLGYLLSHRPIL